MNFIQFTDKCLDKALIKGDVADIILELAFLTTGTVSDNLR
jgi:hypothetical protein